MYVQRWKKFCNAIGEGKAIDKKRSNNTDKASFYHIIQLKIIQMSEWIISSTAIK